MSELSTTSPGTAEPLVTRREHHGFDFGTRVITVPNNLTSGVVVKPSLGAAPALSDLFFCQLLDPLCTLVPHVRPPWVPRRTVSSALYQRTLDAKPMASGRINRTSRAREKGGNLWLATWNGDFMVIYGDILRWYGEVGIPLQDFARCHQRCWYVHIFNIRVVSIFLCVMYTLFYGHWWGYNQQESRIHEQQYVHVYLYNYKFNIVIS